MAGSLMEACLDLNVVDSSVGGCDDDSGEDSDQGVYEENGEDMLVEDICVGELDRYVTPKKISNGSVVPEVEAPKVGMVFPSWEALDTYYRRYGMQEGFGVVRSASAFKGKNGAEKQRRNATWTCECYGRADRRRRVNGTRVVTDAQMEDDKPVKKTKKCECPVMIYASMNEEKEWQIRRVVNEHKNHVPTPRKSRFIAMYRKEEMSNHVKRKLKLGDSAGLKVGQLHNVLAEERNGVDQMAITHRDVRNELAKEKRLRLKDGDANAMLSYFKKMTADDQKFYHTYRVDDNCQMQDILWVDARSRAAYEEFGDVVCFDATYLTNEYELPFVNFVGVNHHGQSILLGCALVSHETAETFEWVFSEWLHCMRGKAPSGILTDQAPAMRKAIAQTMPETRHRWCIWHITQKFCTKLGMYQRYDELKEELLNVIYDSLTVEEFDARWTAVIEKYQLTENEWLEGLYMEKEMWIPACLKHMFWAGMKTTQRVESINSFFDLYVDKHTRLFEFAERYCKALEARAEAERQCDAHNARFTRQLQYGFLAESVFQKCYTDQKFKEVQLECARICFLHCFQQNRVTNEQTEYVMEDRVWYRCKKSKKEILTEHRRNYTVTYDSSCNEMWCACKMFDSTGILCRHMIKLFDILGSTEVPQKYVMKRWRKDVCRRHTRVKVAYHDPTKTVDVRRYDKLQAVFDSIASKSCRHEATFTLALEMLQLMEIRVDEKTVMIENNDATTQTPDSVCNNNITPASVCKRKPDCEQRHGDAQQQNGALPHTVKDPPARSNPHRTTSNRYYSVLDRVQGKVNNCKGGGEVKNDKGKGKGKGNGKGKGKCAKRNRQNTCSTEPLVPPQSMTTLQGAPNQLCSPSTPYSAVEVVDPDGSVGLFVRNRGSGGQDHGGPLQLSSFGSRPNFHPMDLQLKL